MCQGFCHVTINLGWNNYLPNLGGKLYGMQANNERPGSEHALGGLDRVLTN